MTTVRMGRRRHFVGRVFAMASLWMLSAVALADPPAKPREGAPEKLRAIRVAIFDVDVLPGVGVEGPAVSDQLNTMLSALPQVTLVNRDQIKKVADEHQIALSGL
jgi:hypothetical protein